MKQLLVLSNVLLLLSTCDAAAFMSPSESPVSSPSEPSNNDCSTVVYGMFDCLSFLTVGSTDLSPTKTCCEGVKIVLEYNSSCLCVALESSRAMGFDLINNRALAMPSTCNIPIDPHCVSPSKPPTTTPSSGSSPSISTTSPSVPSPACSHSSAAKPGSSPTIIQSPPTLAAPSPAMFAPSPSKSGMENILCLKVARAKKLFIAINVIGEFQILNTHFKKPDIQVQQTNDVMQKQDMNQRQIVDLIMEKGNEHHGFGELSGVDEAGTVDPISVSINTIFPYLNREITMNNFLEIKDEEQLQNLGHDSKLKLDVDRHHMGKDLDTSLKASINRPSRRFLSKSSLTLGFSDLDHVIVSSHSSFLGVNRHMKKSKTKKRCGGGGLENKKERCEETLK
ncbi:hypothetical protein DY000_02060161 [Brassica cretica]|uniref:Bifunctional inhibitor/plant lipid transfer protein/seed storage helical domain-containing protein n=1 Tax=Brassica cretica TaxID=69181 RepID=A0ABQ7AR83_BRACR|nr:hypothetical protein DY000_02060161 [Brassica cretica]